MDIFEPDLEKIEPDNVRDDYGDDAEELLLGESLRKNQDYPILVRPHPTLADWFILVDGHRRFRAARRVGLKKLKAMLVAKGLTEAEIRLIQLRTDFQKKHLTPYERSMVALAIKKANPALNGKQLAALVDMEETLFWKYLQAEKLSPESLAAYQSGPVGVKDVIELAKASHAIQMTMVKVRLDGGTTEDMARARKAAEQALANPPDLDGDTDDSQNGGAKENSLQLVVSSGVTVTIKGKEIDLEAARKAVGEAKQEIERAKDQFHDVRTLNALMKKRKRVKAASQPKS